MSRVNLADAAVSCEASSTMSVSSRSSGRGGWLPEGADGLALVWFIQVVNRAGTTVFVAEQGERRFRGNVFPRSRYRTCVEATPNRDRSVTTFREDVRLQSWRRSGGELMGRMRGVIALVAAACVASACSSSS